MLMTLAACGGGDGVLPNQPPTPQIQDSGNESPAPGETPELSAETTGGSLEVYFTYDKQSGWASNQFALWLEDADGNYVETLYATRYTANGGYKNRPESLSLWVGKSGLADKEKPDVDAVTSATPNPGELVFYKDFADLPGGEYRFVLEGSLRWNNRVVYSGTFNTAEIGGKTAIKADFEHFFEACDNHGELTAESPEIEMLSGVRAYFTPST